MMSPYGPVVKPGGGFLCDACCCWRAVPPIHGDRCQLQPWHSAGRGAPNAHAEIAFARHQGEPIDGSDVRRARARWAAAPWRETREKDESAQVEPAVRLTSEPSFSCAGASPGGGFAARPDNLLGAGCRQFRSMRVDGGAWLEQLPAELAAQRRLLERLLAVCENDEGVRWLTVGCSLARKAADPLSDLDLALGVTDEQLDTACTRVRSAVETLGDVVESFAHQLPGITLPHQRIFAQYADRTQIDLVVVPASQATFSSATVALYDADRRLVLQAKPSPTPPIKVREWAFLALCALADLGKYLRRRSPWEAMERLHQARGELWKLIAVMLEVPDPQYGLTSLLDFAPDQVPADMTTTVSDLQPDHLLAAAGHVARLLGATRLLLPEEAQAVFPDAMLQYITEDLASLEILSI